MGSSGPRGAADRHTDQARTPRAWMGLCLAAGHGGGVVPCHPPGGIGASCSYFRDVSHPLSLWSASGTWSERHQTLSAPLSCPPGTQARAHPTHVGTATAASDGLLLPLAWPLHQLPPALVSPALPLPDINHLTPKSDHVTAATERRLEKWVGRKVGGKLSMTGG